MASLTAQSNSGVALAARAATVTVLVALTVGAVVAHGRQDTTPTGFEVSVLAAGDPPVALANARVSYALEGDTSVKGQVRTGEDGALLVGGLPEGLYSLEVAKSGYLKRTDASVVLVENATTYVDVVLQPEPSSARHIRFGALLFGGVVLVATMARGRSRSHRMRSE